jgi:hypothetical protein
MVGLETKQEETGSEAIAKVNDQPDKRLVLVAFCLASSADAPRPSLRLDLSTDQVYLETIT